MAAAPPKYANSPTCASIFRIKFGENGIPEQLANSFCISNRTGCTEQALRMLKSAFSVDNVRICYGIQRAVLDHLYILRSVLSAQFCFAPPPFPFHK